jgi:hypothetical protein
LEDLDVVLAFVAVDRKALHLRVDYDKTFTAGLLAGPKVVVDA